jgi:hypothetical protein
VHGSIGNEGGFDDRRSGLAALINDRDVVIDLSAIHDVESGITRIDRSRALYNALAVRDSYDRMLDIPQLDESRSDRLSAHLSIDVAET